MSTSVETPPADVTPRRSPRAQRRLGADWTEKYGVVVALLLIIVVFSVLRPETFPTVDNLKNILDQTSVLIILSAGLTVALVLGDFDLSIAATASLAVVLSGVFMAKELWSVPVAILAILGIGIVIGIVNGLFVTKVGINAFIATLATGAIVTGIGQGVNAGVVGFLPDGFISLVTGDIGPVPRIVVVGFGAAAILWVLLERTVIGRHMYAIGESPEAARLAGVRVETLRTAGFAIAGLMAALAGLLLSARAGASQPDAATGLLLPAFAAAFLGASTLRPGEFHILGTVIGVLLASVTVTGLTMVQVPFWIGDVVQGAILLFAVGLARRRR